MLLKEAEKALVLLANCIEGLSCYLLYGLLICLLVVLAVRMFGYYFQCGALQLKDEAEGGDYDCEFAVFLGLSVEEDLDLFFLQFVVASGSRQPTGNCAAEHRSIRIEHDSPALDLAISPVRKSKGEICGEECANAMRPLVPGLPLVPSVSEVYDC